MKLRTFPTAVMQEFKKHSDAVIADQIANDEGFAKVWQSYHEFLIGIRDYNALTLKDYYKNR